MATRKTTGEDFARPGPKAVKRRAPTLKQNEAAPKAAPVHKPAAVKKMQDNTLSGAKPGIASPLHQEKHTTLTEDLRDNQAYRLSLFDAIERNPLGFRKEDFPNLCLETSPIEVLEVLAMSRPFTSLAIPTLTSSFAQYALSKAYVEVGRDFNNQQETRLVDIDLARAVLSTGVLRGQLIGVLPDTLGVTLHNASVQLISEGKNVAMIALIQEKVVKTDPVADSFPATERPWAGNSPGGLAQPHSGGFGSSFNQQPMYGGEEAKMGPEIIDLICGNAKCMYYTSVLDTLFNYHFQIQPLPSNSPGSFRVHTFETSNHMLEVMTMVLKTGIFSDKTFVVNPNSPAYWWVIASNGLQAKGLKVAKFV